MQLAAARGYWHTRAMIWSTDAEEAPLAQEALASKRNGIDGAHEVILEADDALLIVHVSTGKASVRICGSELLDAEAALAWIRELLPQSTPEVRHEAKVEFWTWGELGPESVDRKLPVPSWDDLRANYAGSTLAGLEDLMRWRPEPDGGRLLLWHGPPGTGKTHALRALGWEWREWCDLHYITDPETFFGAKPSYMLRLLIDQDEAEEDDRWRLLVLEDTGELMRVDAKDRVGQGLSRLLNLVDGMIGQGFPVLALVTTNEPLAELHDAISRPGRCAVNLDFEPLPIEQAAAWLRAHGSDHVPHGELTLAELYSILRGDVPRARRRIGFAA
jgi:hypothetical protein